MAAGPEPRPWLAGGKVYMRYGGRAKRGFGSQTPSNCSDRAVFRAIRDRSALGMRKDHKRSGLGEETLCAHSLPKKKDGGRGHVCEEESSKEKRQENYIRGLSSGASC